MWMKIDDGLHAHRKTRAVTKSGAKKRDAAPMGLWVLAGSWAAQNGTDGWVPEEELDRWDDDWRTLTSRLVRAGYWWPHQRDGEPGYGFNDWLDYNPESEAASKSGTYGNHVRWHANRGQIDPECAHCPREPDSTGLDQLKFEPEEPVSEPVSASAQVRAGVSGGDREAISHPDRGGESQTIALPVPDPTPTRPDPTPRAAIALRPDAPTAQTLVAEWIDHCDEQPPKNVIGQIAKHTKALLDEGIEADRVRRALAEWNRKGLHPSTLASVVHEISNRQATGVRGQQATDDLFDRAMKRAVAREEAAR